MAQFETPEPTTEQQPTQAHPPSQDTNVGAEATALVPSDAPGAAISRRSSKPLRKLPWYFSLMTLTHLAVSRDLAQHRQWRDQAEGIQMLETLDRVKDHRTRALLRRKPVWKLVRGVSRAGASLNLAASAPWLLWLIPLYALGHGFGWLAALAFLLPVPIAWGVAQRLFEDAAIESIHDAEHEGESPLGSLQRWTGGTARSFVAGFGFGFTLLFLQGLISWFMTPESSLMMELFLDAYNATVGGLVSGSVSMLVSPIIAMTGRAALNAAERTPQQLE